MFIRACALKYIFVCEANLKNIFFPSYPTLFCPYGLVGQKVILLTSQIWYPLNLIVYKMPLKKSKKKIFFSGPIIV